MGQWMQRDLNNARLGAHYQFCPIQSSDYETERVIEVRLSVLTNSAIIKNWLQNLYISASLGWLSMPSPKTVYNEKISIELSVRYDKQELSFQQFP